MIKSKQFFFWIFTFSILIVLIVPVLIQDGMFMDGVLYSCVSKNLSHGIGSFWFPHYSPTLYPFFDQQPPLGFAIQSFFFKLFGDGMYVERFYSFLCAVITAIIISRFWKLLFKNDIEFKGLSWLPVLFWITIPVCFWAYANNVLENTMAIFALMAEIYVLKYILHKQTIIYLIIAGLFIFLATFTKGIQGSFPIATLFLGWSVYRNFSFLKMMIASLFVLLVPVMIYFFLMLNSDAYESITTYLSHRVLNSIQNISEVESRFYLALRLLQELAPSIIFSLLIVMVSIRKMREREVAPIIMHKKHILFLVLVGISASFPLMVTLEQRGFYLTTSLPYYATAIAVFIAPALAIHLRKINYASTLAKFLRILSVGLFIAAITVSSFQVGKNSRDKEMLHDSILIGKVVPHGTILGSTKVLWFDWSLQEYLIRKFYIAQDDTIAPKHDFILVTDPNSIPPELNVEKLKIGTIKYHLYKRLD